MPKAIPQLRPAGYRPTSARYERGGARLEDKRFYASSRWRSLRAAKLAADPLCEPCKAQGRTTAAAQVHHVRPRKTHPGLALDRSNLESVCVPCHNAMESR